MENSSAAGVRLTQRFQCHKSRIGGLFMSDKIGRPRLYKGSRTPLHRQTGRYTDWHIQVALLLGDNNFGAGSRRAIEIAAKHMSLDVLEKPIRSKRI